MAKYSLVTHSEKDWQLKSDINYLNDLKEEDSKRIKVKIEEDQTEKVNKVEDLKELAGQVNDRIKRGFHKVYLTVLIVCDGRNKITNNIFFNHATAKTLESIYTHPYLNKLNIKAGILFLELSQLTEKDYNQQAGCGIYEMRNQQLKNNQKN